MHIELLYFDGCPSWQQAERNLREAITLVGVDATVSLVHVGTPEDADRLSFRGSPTVLVDGADPFAQPGDPVGLSCRVFRTPDGLRGVPTVGQLVDVLR
ncbi:MAG TPA: thioredoxin family protein [Mycobacteriales bacterium]|nr:thioredoxin family protein [Mycobacteriales bacterium]